MSSADNIEVVGKAEARMLHCASCGIAGLDDIKLTDCNGCDLVRYCSDTCQELHRPEHAEKCKKRAAELRDELLFKQPEGRHHGDCPICCLPFPLDPNQFMLLGCCSKSICAGCVFADRAKEASARAKCPFCRLPVTESSYQGFIERAEANDPCALHRMGELRFDKGDYDSAIKYWTKAAGLGNGDAHYDLFYMYLKGEGVEKDEGKELYHLEEAAIAGHPFARYNLAMKECTKYNVEREVKHLIIGANLGSDQSMHILKEHYKNGNITKDDFVATLRGHYAAVAETKSQQRKDAEAAMKRIAEEIRAEEMLKAMMRGL